MRKLILFAVFLLSLNLGAKDKVLIRQPQECFIGLHDNQLWQLPPWDGKGRVVVSFEQRLDFPRLNGWNPCWQLSVNDRLLSAMADRNTPRLLNKELTAIHIDYGLSRVCKGDKWFALYSPDYEQAIAKFLPANEEAYRITVDISDALSRQELNILRIRFGAELEGYYRNWGIKRRPALAIRNFSVVQEDTPTKLKPIPPEKDFVKVRRLPRPEFTFTDGGHATVTFGGRSYVIRSVFSLPGERTKTVTVGEENPFYTVLRKVEKKEDRIDIFDTFTSKSDRLIGLRIAYEMDTAEFPRIYLAGDSSPSRSSNQDGRNPSVFFPDTAHGTGVGLLAQDDVFRVQNVQYCEKGKAGIRTETFALQPGESRTVEWSIYPVMSDDYFDFVNTVRRDWEVNFTIPGELHLSLNVFRDWQKAPQRAQDFHRRNGIGMNVYGVHYWRYKGGEWKDWRSAVFGPAIMKESSRVNVGGGRIESHPVQPLREFEKGTFDIAKQILPGLKRLYYIHTQWSTETDDYRIYADSALRTKDGKFYTGIEEPYHFFIPTLTNSFGKAMLETVDKIIGYFDPEGIYIDETTCSPLRITYDMWDQVSVELDRNNDVKCKIGYVTLLKRPFMMKLYDKIINEHRKILVGNFGPETRTERQFHFPRFEETCNSWWIFYSHLYTPIQLGDVSTYGMTPEENMADIRNAMRNGTLYYLYANTSAAPTITQKMFPFTPIEIHSGWLMGKERILTCISGEFGWHGSRQLAELFVYDKFGKSTGDYSAEFFAEEGETRVRLRLKPGQCAAILPIPVEADMKGDIRLLEPRYENGVFSCTAAGNGSVTLKKGEKTQTITVNQPIIRF